MNEIPVKYWWQSKTIIASLVTILASLAGILGYTLNVPLATELLFSLITLITGILTWYGRIKAEKLIDKKTVIPGLKLKT